MSDYDDIFAELKVEYLDSFTEKLETIENLWQKNKLDDLEMEFHKIKGTGTTYGIEEASSVGAIMESLCKENHEQLGTCLLISTELFIRIRDCYVNKNDWNLEGDEQYQKLCSLISLKKSA